jgi:hypothetical protein
MSTRNPKEKEGETESKDDEWLENEHVQRVLSWEKSDETGESSSSSDLSLDDIKEALFEDPEEGFAPQLVAVSMLATVVGMMVFGILPFGGIFGLLGGIVGGYAVTEVDDDERYVEAATGVPIVFFLESFIDSGDIFKILGIPILDVIMAIVLGIGFAIGGHYLGQNPELTAPVRERVHQVRDEYL